MAQAEDFLKRRLQAQQELQREEQETRSCPYCGERIAISAKKCRFCGELLDEKERKARARESQSQTFVTQTVENGCCGSVVGEILAAIIGLPIIIIIALASGC